MIRIVLTLLTVCLLVGCASDPVSMQLPPADGEHPYSEPTPHYTAPTQSSHSSSQPLKTYNMADLKRELGMNRDRADLGFVDKNFDGCQTAYKGDAGECGPRIISVLNFRLVCRDTVGTTSRAPSSLTPLTTNSLEWRFAGARGITRTDEQGYGQVQVVSTGPVGSQRFMLIIGAKLVGVEAAEVTQLVLPKNFCQQHLAMD